MKDPYGDGNGPIENLIPFRPLDRNERIAPTPLAEMSASSIQPDTDPLHNFPDEVLIKSLFRRGRLKIANASRHIHGADWAQFGGEQDFQEHVNRGLSRMIGETLYADGFALRDTHDAPAQHVSGYGPDKSVQLYVAALTPRGGLPNGA